MKCLVVTTHPLRESLCGHLTDHVVSSLRSLNHDVFLEDLYQKGFEPALTALERESYYSPVYNTSNVSDEVRRLTQAQALVLLFPTWWFGFPAMLKGWFDRVWGPGIAYDHAGDLGAIKPRLNRLKNLLAVTTLGAPWWVDYLVMHRPVKKVIKTALLTACARNSRLSYLSLYKSENLNEKNITRFKYKIDKVLNGWNAG